MAVTTVRPNSTDRQTSVGTTGAVAPHTVLSDTNTATRASGTANKGTLWLGVPSVTVSSTVRLARARIGLVYANDGADIGHAEAANYRFRDPTLNVAGVDSQASSASVVYQPAGSPNYGPWNTAAPSGAAWTQAIIDRLQVSLYWLTSSGGAGSWLSVAEVYVQFDTNTQPVVSAVTVTGAATTTRPAFSWTWTDADGDTQTAWQAKVFSAAQYGAAGFNPDTSASTWDSGVVLSDSTAGTVGVDLANTGTYEVYVRAGQDWAGPEGSPWWSPWAASAPFTIALSPPPTPSITVTQELTLPRYANRVVVSLAGINVLDADTASFEVSAGFWVADTNCTVTTSATNPKSGVNALQMTATAAGTMAARSGSFATSRRVRPGGTYSATASFRAATTGRTVNAGIRWFDVTGAQVGADVYGPNQTDTTTGYVTATLTGSVAPASAWSAVALAKVTSAAAAEVHRVDEAGLVIGSSATWTPGGYFQAGTVTVEASQRISDTIVRGRAPGLEHPQIFSSGALTQNADGFYPRVATDEAVFRQLDRAPPEAPAQTTTGMIEWRVRTGVAAFLDIGAPAGVATDGTNPYLFPVVPGRPATATCWLWAPAAVSVRLQLVTTDNLNTALQTDSSTVTALTTTPQRVTVTGTPPAGAVWGRLAVEDNSATANISIFLTMTRARLASEPDEPWPGQMFAFTRYTVRGGVVPVPQDGADTVTVVDHEAPPGRYLLYTASVASTTPAGQAIASARSTPVPVYMDPPAWSLLKAPFVPGGENALLVYRAPGDTVTLDEDATELHPAGRDKDPVFTRDWLSGDTGQILFHLFTDLDLYRMQQLVPSSRTMLIQWSSGGQVYCRITAQPTVHVRGTYRTATLTYTQQARPT